MYIVEDDGSLDALLEADTRGEPLGEHRDPDGNLHRLYRVSNALRIKTYRELLAPAASVIADGHHRTKTAQLFAKKHEPSLTSAASAKMAVMISLASSALKIDPIHRAVSIEVDLDALGSIPAERSSLAGKSGTEIAAAVAAAPAPSIAVQAEGEIPNSGRSMPRARRATSRQRHQPRRRPAAPLAPAHGRTGHRDGHRWVDPLPLRSRHPRRHGPCGECRLAVWLPPMSPSDFAAATAGGQVLPAKATRFLPKVVSGLVWAEHDAEVV